MLIRKREAVGKGALSHPTAFSWHLEKTIMLIGFMSLHKQAVVLTLADPFGGYEYLKGLGV